MMIVLGTVAIAFCFTMFSSIILPSIVPICVTISMIIVARVVGRKYDAQLIAMFGFSHVMCEILKRTEEVGKDSKGLVFKMWDFIARNGSVEKAVDASKDFKIGDITHCFLPDFTDFF